MFQFLNPAIHLYVICIFSYSGYSTMMMTWSLLFWLDTCRVFYFYFRYWMRCSKDMLRISFLLLSISWIHIESSFLFLFFLYYNNSLKLPVIPISGLWIEYCRHEITHRSNFLIEKYIRCYFWLPLPFKLFSFFIKLKLFN